MYYFVGAAVAVMAIAVFSFSDAHSLPEGVSKKKTHRIVFQITTPDTSAYRALTRQLNNVLDHWPQARVEVVAHNKGINLLVKDKTNVPAELTALKKRGVDFYACEFTLRQLSIPKADIIAESGYVERGIVHIVERQEEGWAYIKAGF